MTHNEIINNDKSYHMPTYGRFDVALTSGKGAYAYDADGKKYVDFSAGIGVNCLGYCDDGWVRAVSGQAAALQHCSNLYACDVQASLARLLCEKSGFERVFFCNSGAEANECAIKLARKYSYDKYGGGRNEIITLVNSFHGRTVTTVSATGQDSFHNYFFPFTEGFKYAVSGDMGDVRDKLDKTVCAVMVELIQGEGGVIPQDPEFIRGLAELCRQNDVLLIIDEVQTGVGRTGTLYCYEQYGIVPDIITSAKGLAGGLPFGACLCRGELSGVMTSGTHGSTFGGNPVCCAAASYILGRVTDREFLEGVVKRGEYIRGRLSEIPDVDEIRGLGMMIGISLKRHTAAEAAKECAQNGLLILTAKKLLRMLPPLNISYEAIDEGIEILKTVLA